MSFYVLGLSILRRGRQYSFQEILVSPVIYFAFTTSCLICNRFSKSILLKATFHKASISLPNEKNIYEAGFSSCLLSWIISFSFHPLPIDKALFESNNLDFKQWLWPIDIILKLFHLLSGAYTSTPFGTLYVSRFLSSSPKNV